MRKMLLMGVVALALSGCKDKSKQVEPVDDDDQEVTQRDERGGHRGGRHRICEAPDADVRIAKMQKCQSPEAAACNTEIYGSATPTKDAMCADKDKMRQVFKCVREKFAGDREKMRADRKRMHECTSAP
jgi:hypothetical protein